MFTRALMMDSGGLARAMSAGEGFAAMPVIATFSTDANNTISVANLSGGVYQRTGTNTTRTDTTDTAANIIAAMPTMGIGDSFVCAISNATAAALTIAGGTGVTLAGNAPTTLAANTTKWYIFTKTAAATITATAL